MIDPTNAQEIETAILELQAYLAYFYNLKKELLEKKLTQNFVNED